MSSVGSDDRWRSKYLVGNDVALVVKLMEDGRWRMVKVSAFRVSVSCSLSVAFLGTIYCSLPLGSRYFDEAESLRLVCGD